MSVNRKRSPRTPFNKSKFVSSNLAPRRSLMVSPTAPSPHYESSYFSNVQLTTSSPNKEALDLKAKFKTEMDSLKLLLSLPLPAESLLSPSSDYELSLISYQREAKTRLIVLSKVYEELCAHRATLVSQRSEEIAFREQTIDRYDKLIERKNIAPRKQIQSTTQYYTAEISSRQNDLESTKQSAQSEIQDKLSSQVVEAKEVVSPVFLFKDKIMQRVKTSQAFSDIKELEINKIENTFRRRYEQTINSHKKLLTKQSSERTKEVSLTTKEQKAKAREMKQQLIDRDDLLKKLKDELVQLENISAQNVQIIK